ncbi:MAG: hypothetical protein IPJ13_00420 [Saprospiraceae bacterium]|nr:hypothetical protein [Saprospiraceae bacterium]
MKEPQTQVCGCGCHGMSKNYIFYPWPSLEREGRVICSLMFGDCAKVQKNIFEKLNLK